MTGYVLAVFGGLVFGFLGGACCAFAWVAWCDALSEGERAVQTREKNAEAL